jgi:hypothetical protein
MTNILREKTNREKEKKIYKGEVGEIYKVKFAYDSRDGWLKRRLLDIYYWITGK